MAINYVTGDLIEMAKKGHFYAVVHGCNCFRRMKRGIAPQMALAFQCDQFPMEVLLPEGDQYKLGKIDVMEKFVVPGGQLWVVNAYTQHHWSTPGHDGIPLNYRALRMCFERINKYFYGRVVGIPRIGAKLAGGDWKRIEEIIIKACPDVHITVVTLPNEVNEFPAV